MYYCVEKRIDRVYRNKSLINLLFTGGMNYEMVGIVNYLRSVLSDFLSYFYRLLLHKGKTR